MCHSNEIKNLSLKILNNLNGIINYEIINESYNSERFENYLEKLIKENNIKNKYILMDNVNFHKTKKVKEIL